MSNYGGNGYIDFSKFWVMLEKKNKNKQWLINNGVHRNTVYKLVNNENITCEVICNLCKLLNCQPGQIMEYKPLDKAETEEPAPEEPQNEFEGVPFMN